MGCINSTKKNCETNGATLNATTNGNSATLLNGTLNGTATSSLGHGGEANNVYRVRAVRLQPDMPMCRNGYLELTPREIVFLPLGSSSGSSAGTQNVPVIWSLQHLRRYGVNGETFSFEAGRRCMTGPGIFTFRLPEAETLYSLFQRYINDVTTLTDDMFQFQGHNIDNPTTYNLSRAHAHTNNYLEPTNAQRSAAAARSDYFGSSSPMSMDLDSPDSLPSLSFGGNEVVHFSHNSRYTPQMQAAAEQLSLQTTGNIYSERPMGSSSSQYQQHREHNNNINRSECSIYGGVGVESTTASAFSTMSRKLMVRRSSMDMPPKECAPLLLTPTTPTLRLYANIEQWADAQISMAADCCYENITAANSNSYSNDMTLNNMTASTSINNKSNPTTPGGITTTISRMASIADPESMSLGSGGEQSISGTAAAAAITTTTINSGMNYIVLDLDQPRSPSATGTTYLQYSPKTQFGSAFSLSMANNNNSMIEEHVDENSINYNVGTPTSSSNMNSMFENKISTTIAASITNSNINSLTLTTTTKIATTSAITTSSSIATMATTTTITTAAAPAADNLNEQLDYSTIDFVKTGALIESNGMDFDIDTDADLAEEEESRITRHSKCVRKAYSISE